MSALWPIQASIVGLLRADPDYPVYDGRAPQDAPMPYVVIGEPTEVPGEEIDEEGTNATLTFHGWSAYAGKKECFQMQAWLRSHLHHAEVAGTWACYEELATILADDTGGGRLYHLVTRYRIRL